MAEVLYLTQEVLDGYMGHLYAEDRSHNTMLKYKRDLDMLLEWLNGREVTKAALTEYKHWLSESGRAPSSINSSISAINGLVRWLHRYELKLPFVKVQRKVFRDTEQELTREDYDLLVSTAYANGQERLGLVLETLGSTGIRISELHCITVEAVAVGTTDINLKCKIRTVMLPEKLCGKLSEYCKARGILHGEVFLTRTGRPLSRQEIWREMKALCQVAGVPDSKVYPHNFRHMFATVFYASCHDVVKLADVLGHSNINTTRIYLISSGKEHARHLESLGLVK